MRHNISLILTILLIAGWWNGWLTAAPPQTTVGEIKKSLVCLCKCNMTVEACEGAMTCESAEKLTAEITRYIEQGLSKDAVFAAFTQKYGEHILAAPTKKGFNLTAWILPFLALSLAAIAIVFALRRWVRQQQQSNALVKGRAVEASFVDAAYEQKLDEVLRNLD